MTVRIPGVLESLPFSFVYGGRPIRELLNRWERETRTGELEACREKSVTTWRDPDSGLCVEWEVTEFTDYPAVEWVLHFENCGDADTPIIEDVQSLDLTFRSPLSGDIPYRLHRTNGAPSNPTDFEPSIIDMTAGRTETMGGGGGRSSNKDFTFFKVETGDASVIIAVGWSGQWHASISSTNDTDLRLCAGLERTHFLLHPGERVRSPRMLVTHWVGDTLESNAQFRQLIYKHYAVKRNGQNPLPILFCNTAFTRGGGWLNECNAENQISLIEAYAPLGLEALITDAGWFEGGWPDGAGNWNPRRDAYPEGLGPVARAAMDRGMVYGLWFEPERVVDGTWLQTNRPEWILSRSNPDPTLGSANPATHLLNFGLPEVQEYFFNIVKDFMELPGFRFYRQDFNMDPLPYWADNDAPDRQGMREMKYVEGLYAYWDRIRATWPDVVMEECASGGRRIDLETIRRFDTHQESDYWFDNEADQNQIWGLSQYLPNNLINTPLIRLDDYSFHSTMAGSLIPGWIADEPGFDVGRAKKLLDRYREVRHLLIGSWYPLLPYSRDPQSWLASQYHRADLDEGMILAFRRPDSPNSNVVVRPRGLDPSSDYEVSWDSTGERKRLGGLELMESFTIEIPEKHRSDLITYRKTTD